MMRNSKNFNFWIVIIVVLFLGLGIGFCSNQVLIKYPQILRIGRSQTPIDAIKWIHIESKRAGLSFKYPATWPIDFEPDTEIAKDNQYYDESKFNDRFRIESIDFTREWYRNAGGERYGSFSVWKQKGIDTLDDYIKSIDKEDKVYAKGAIETTSRPKIRYSVVGGEVAISIFYQDGGARLDSPNDKLDYTIVKDGVIYRFSATKSDPFMQDETLNSQIFKEIISSIKFGS